VWVEQHDPGELEPVPHTLTCSVCGREWSADTDGKWPIRVTAADPPRVTASSTSGTPSELLAEFRLSYGPTMNASDAAAANGRADELEAELDALVNVRLA
jgi:hypothetical protein